MSKRLLGAMLVACALTSIANCKQQTALAVQPESITLVETCIREIDAGIHEQVVIGQVTR